MTTNPPRVKAGGLPPTQLHRVDASLLNDNRAVIVAADVESKYANSPMPYTEIEEADEDGPARNDRLRDRDGSRHRLNLGLDVRMSRTKDHYWPPEPPTPRPVLCALRAAWCEFKRVREQQRRRDSIPDPFRSNP